MSENHPPKNTFDEPEFYEIRVKGHLDERWARRFDDLSITLAENGDSLLTGPVVDQAALYGLIRKARDIGMALVSINQVPSQEIHQIHSDMEQKMNPNNNALEKTRAILSTLWIFLLFNMVFADIYSFMVPGFLKQIVAGAVVDGTPITPVFLLIAAIVTEVSIAMVFLSRILKYGLNRWVNIIGAIITILWVIGGGSTTLHYIFFATIEVVCALVIIWLAWKWRSPVGQA